MKKSLLKNQFFIGTFLSKTDQPKIYFKLFSLGKENNLKSLDIFLWRTKRTLKNSILFEGLREYKYFQFFFFLSEINDVEYLHPIKLLYLV